VVSIGQLSEVEAALGLEKFISIWGQISEDGYEDDVLTIPDEETVMAVAAG
jgi:hypothetical protein